MVQIKAINGDAAIIVACKIMFNTLAF
jgi:hypothetical protein